MYQAQDDKSIQLNKKKVKVNAQVSAMISLLEITFAIIFGIFLFVKNATTISGCTVAIILYDVLLPHVFLMNTSHNKNRIVEFGWKNVFKNIFGLSNNSMEESTATIHDNSRTSNLKSHLKIKGKTKFKQNDDIRVFATSSSSQIKSKVENNSTSDVSYIVEASDSKGARPSGCVNLDAKKLVKQDDYKIMIDKLVHSMMNNEKEEEIYMLYLKKLLAMQNSHIKGQLLTDIELENEFSSRYEHAQRNKHPRGKGKRSQSSTAKEFTTEQCPNSCHNQQFKLKGELRDRILLRREILKQIYNSCNVDKTYNQLIENLIDLEESFVEDD